MMYEVLTFQVVIVAAFCEVIYEEESRAELRVHRMKEVSPNIETGSSQIKKVRSEIFLENSLVFLDFCVICKQ